MHVLDRHRRKPFDVDCVVWSSTPFLECSLTDQPALLSARDMLFGEKEGVGPKLNIPSESVDVVMIEVYACRPNRGGTKGLEVCQ